VSPPIDLSKTSLRGAKANNNNGGNKSKEKSTVKAATADSVSICIGIRQKGRVTLVPMKQVLGLRPSLDEIVKFKDNLMANVNSSFKRNSTNNNNNQNSDSENEDSGVEQEGEEDPTLGGFIVPDSEMSDDSSNNEQKQVLKKKVPKKEKEILKNFRQDLPMEMAELMTTTKSHMNRMLIKRMWFSSHLSDDPLIILNGSSSTRVMDRDGRWKVMAVPDASKYLTSQWRRLDYYASGSSESLDLLKDKLEL
jgi:hypothetical protein